MENHPPRRGDRPRRRHAGRAITVDSVEAVETIDPASVELLEEKGVESFSSVIRRVGQRPRGAGLVGLIDESQILDIVAGAALPAAA